MTPRTGQADEAGRLHARVDVAGSGRANVATMSLARPATRASLRSAFETTSGRPEASTTT